MNGQALEAKQLEPFENAKSIATSIYNNEYVGTQQLTKGDNLDILTYSSQGSHQGAQRGAKMLFPVQAQSLTQIPSQAPSQGNLGL